MLKKILAATLAAMMLVAVATSCDKEPEKGSSSKKPTSSVESVADIGEESEIASSDIAQVESEPNPDEDHGYDYTIKTMSAFFRDTDEAKQSVSESTTIKQFKNKGTYMIGCYQVRMGAMDHYGTDTLSRAKEFEDVVRAGYFNCYLIAYDQKYNQYELPLIAETGGTFWLSLGRYTTPDNATEAEKKEKEEAYIAKVQEAVDYIDSLGCLDLLNGFYYDEPIWTGQKNEDFLTQTKIHYVNFGLRNFPVFATGEFTAEEGNIIGGQLGNADEMRKVTPEACKYVTDISFDSYRVDVRPEATYTQATYDRWEKNTGNVHECSSGLDYYTAHRKWLIEYIGHPANFYHYPTAYHVSSIQGGLTSVSDEAFCTGHLEGLAKDVLSDKAGGGLMLYTYPSSEGSLNLAARLPIKDKNGYYTMFQNEEKWFTYSEALKNVKKKFDSTKQTIQYKTVKSK